MHFSIESIKLSFDQIIFQKNDKMVQENCRKPYKNHPKGCPNYGKNWSCPPYSPTIKETKANLSKYRYFWLIRIKIGTSTHPIKVWAKYKNSKLFEKITMYLNEFLGKLQEEHPKDKIYFCSECRICKNKGYSCTCPSEPCRYPEKMHFSPEALGIDLFNIMRNLDLDIEHNPSKILQRIGLYASDHYLNFPEYRKI
ncbi:MAG: hypothetical protein DRO88_12840 [Promethearchaeia archaeon]|nr:MAG: hypothetical protein DRO88_12840 [Candidatus Lokiarchaeia archaeon]